MGNSISETQVGKLLFSVTRGLPQATRGWLKTPDISRKPAEDNVDEVPVSDYPITTSITSFFSNSFLSEALTSFPLPPVKLS